MEPALPVKYMVWVLLETLPSASTTIRLGVLQVAVDFVQDKSQKRRCCRRLNKISSPTPPRTPASPVATTADGDVLPSQQPAIATQLIAGLIQAAGRPACKRALRALGAQFHYILHGPLAEPHEYADPTLVECEARHCLTAADLRSIDGGRVAEWAAAQPASKVAPTVRVRMRV